LAGRTCTAAWEFAKLGSKLFECRGNVALRFIFQDRPSELFVSFLGNHAEIKALLKSGKYR
jgi:hypothetical protein